MDAVIRIQSVVALASNRAMSGLRMARGWICHG